MGAGSISDCCLLLGPFPLTGLPHPALIGEEVSYCNLICHGWLKYMGSLPFAEEKAGVVDGSGVVKEEELGGEEGRREGKLIRLGINKQINI